MMLFKKTKGEFFKLMNRQGFLFCYFKAIALYEVNRIVFFVVVGHPLLHFVYIVHRVAAVLFDLAFFGFLRFF